MSKFEPKIPISKTNKNLKIGIILPYFNEHIGLKLYKKIHETLVENGVKKTNIKLIRVPGALEIPFAALQMAKSKKIDSIIAIGAVIKGKTDHYYNVSKESYRGLMDISLKYEIPIINGILTVNNEKQALERIKNGELYAKSAILMSNLKVV
ncbi:MAG: 6,7-dimethyl-8-ribityllumazine synthase, 6,7-dimethyl-8-ribityllumazine synthase [Candidatus Peregrinibacteria bacterium GW2011_GWF2_38_29]|nr:MAG: 6,7-dimethyl-8-ribityllumazine synthase, 6,7-dimethyl-8-ribityllumazine synthase [Candidatus Peregrinibacteria bacterium GW2011_GWF2_38_29]HBB03006.1 6,7-dimethyl-8-ribityllumazine synthase [Candidatus Peregrinibacteria bacterium]